MKLRLGDAGISGAKGREARPGLDEMLPLQPHPPRLFAPPSPTGFPVVNAISHCDVAGSRP